MTRSRINADNSRSNTRSFASTSEPTAIADGTIWVDTDGIPAAVQRLRWKKTPAAGTTVFTGLNDDGNFSLIYTPNYEEVFLNGVLLVRGVDYAATSGDSFTIVEATVAGDVVEVFCTPNLAVTDVYTTSQTEARYLSKSLVDAKGDLYVATADNTTARLPVGINDQVLVADSAATGGVSWKSYGSQESAGKNFAINGGMDVWARGTSFTATGLGYATYTVDRWHCYAGAAGTITQDTSLFAPGARYGLRFTSTVASSGQNWYQMIETANAIVLAGQTVTLSTYAAGTVGVSGNYLLLWYSTNTDAGLFDAGWTACTTLSTQLNPTINGSMQRYATVYSVPSNAKSLRIQWTTGTLTNTQFQTISGVQLELGSVATPFSRTGGTIAGEIQECQRYYWRATSANAFGGLGGNGFTFSTTQATIQMQAPVPMRTYPSSCDFSNIRYVDVANAAANISGVTLWQASTAVSNTSLIDFQATGTGFTSGRYAFLQTSSGNGFIGFSAEL